MITTLISKQDADFQWIDISNPNAEELSKVATEFKLHPSSVKDCLQSDHLPKYEFLDDIHFIILRVYDVNSSEDCDTIQQLTRKIAVFIGSDFIITIHRIAFDFINFIKESFFKQIQYKNQYFIIHKLIRYSIEAYNVPSSKVMEDIDKYETKIFLKEKTPSLLKDLYFNKRKASVFNRMLALTKPILDNLKEELPSTVIVDLQDSLTASRLNAEQIIENVNNLLNIYISLSSQRTNEVMRILTIFSVFFMPLTFIVGIYGMNFDFMPELKLTWGYPAVMILCVLITVIIYLWFRRKRWI